MFLNVLLYILFYPFYVCDDVNFGEFLKFLTIFPQIFTYYFQQNVNARHVKLMKKIFLKLILLINKQEKTRNRRRIVLMDILFSI